MRQKVRAVLGLWARFVTIAVGLSLLATAFAIRQDVREGSGKPRAAIEGAAKLGTDTSPISTIALPKTTPVLAPEIAEWQDKEFTDVKVIDGRTFRAEVLKFRLAGLTLPPLEAECYHLDGRPEPCVSRARTQLEIIAERWRTFSCRYVLVSDEAVGSCRVNGADLAEQLIRRGYVARTGERPLQ